MSTTALHQHECSQLGMVGARHRVAFAWCGTAITSATTVATWTMPNTKRQRLKEPSPG
jgi:hypothetical protein